VVVLACATFYLSWKLYEIAQMRRHVPKRKDNGLRTGISVVVGLCLMSTLFSVTAPLATTVNKTALPLNAALILGSLPVYLLLVAVFVAPAITTAKPSGWKAEAYYGPGWVVSSSNWIYVEVRRKVFLGAGQFFYGAARIMRDSIRLRDNSLLTVEISFLPNPNRPDFYAERPQFYDENVVSAFRDFCDVLRSVEHPTDEALRDFRASHDFGEKVIAQIKSFMPGRELEPPAEQTSAAETATPATA
jgi:hypothetical protein